MMLLKEMFGSLGGWLMFVLGVFLSGWVMKMFASVKNRAYGGGQ